jgi:hypothetical protein
MLSDGSSVSLRIVLQKTLRRIMSLPNQIERHNAKKKRKKKEKKMIRRKLKMKRKKLLEKRMKI